MDCHENHHSVTLDETRRPLCRTVCRTQPRQLEALERSSPGSTEQQPSKPPGTRGNLRPGSRNRTEAERGGGWGLAHRTPAPISVNHRENRRCDPTLHLPRDVAQTRKGDPIKVPISVVSSAIFRVALVAPPIECPPPRLPADARPVELGHGATSFGQSPAARPHGAARPRHWPAKPRVRTSDCSPAGGSVAEGPRPL